jgi:hypothetical protein
MNYSKNLGQFRGTNLLTIVVLDIKDANMRIINY